MGMPNEFSIAIDADHIEMTKFINRMDTSYQMIIDRILSRRNPFSESYKLGQFSRFNKRLDVCPLMIYSCYRDEK